MNGESTGSVITGAIMVVLIIVFLYYLYQWLYNSTISTNNDITQGNMYPFDVNARYKSAPKSVSSYKIERVADGGTYTANIWVYITDAKGSQNLQSLLEIGNRDTGKATMLYIGLNPINGGLVVRQNTQDTTNDQPVDVPGMITGYNSGTTYKAKDRCDIINGIEYQRWIMITAVANGRTLDVYIDGKLARSCVYKGQYSTGVPDGKVTASIGKDNMIKGFFSGVTFDTVPISPDTIWSMYQNGPSNATLWQQIKNFFHIDFSVPDPCTQCQSGSK